MKYNTGIETTVGLVIDRSTAFYRLFHERCTFTNKTVWTVETTSSPNVNRDSYNPYIRALIQVTFLFEWYVYFSRIFTHQYLS